MSRLSDITKKATLLEYSQGAAQAATQPIADFLAPTVGVSAPVGFFKKYSEKSRFLVPDTRRASGGAAVRIGWSASDATYNCHPHALDVPVDHIEKDADESVIQEAAALAAEIGALSHEKIVSETALAAVGAGESISLATEKLDLIATLDEKIISIIKAAKYGSLMGVGILFGAAAWVKFKNHKSVSGKFTVGIGTKGLINPGVEDVGGLLLGKPEARVSMMVYDSAPEGKDEDIKFVLENDILLFARHSNPTRRDPSFMKTFRLNGKWMVPGTYETEDGRGEVLKMDWSQDVQATNPNCAKRLVLTA
ncbi:MAG: hypothetical protein LBC18_03030 [Opitutaceae bacterium]|jgi:hypothetical protein|nr:hypothetical protein [Opitutaceae bacterium]